MGDCFGIGNKNRINAKELLIYLVAAKNRCIKQLNEKKNHSKNLLRLINNLSNDDSFRSQQQTNLLNNKILIEKLELTIFLNEIIIQQAKNNYFVKYIIFETDVEKRSKIHGFLQCVNRINIDEQKKFIEQMNNIWGVQRVFDAMNNEDGIVDFIIINCFSQNITLEQGKIDQAQFINSKNNIEDNLSQISEIDKWKQNQLKSSQEIQTIDDKI